MGWFRRVRGKAPKAPASEPAIPTHHSRNPSSADVVQITHADVDGYSDDDDDSGSRFRPAHPAAQFHGAPGRRLATLYISPSETNLYLQALAGLDTANPELPLWSEPAPELPQLEIDAQPIPLPNIPYPTTPDIIPSLHPNRQNRRHGLLILSGDDGVHLSGFPSVMVSDVDTALRTWRLGVASRSNELEDVAKRHPEMPTYWKAELKGKVWRLKGTQELESIRLLLAIFDALARHGYTMVGAIQPATSKPESHNLLFTYSPNTEEVPPLFFAVTLPLPDRISLVNPPLPASAQLLTNVRNAITVLHRPPPVPTHTTHFKAIKLEGWVHPGVYRFWLAGLRRWPGGAGGVKRDLVAKIQPQIILAITDAVAALNFAFVGSVPLLPRTAARDVLIFCSRPESGLCHYDAYSEESERNRKSALLRSASARTAQRSSDEHSSSGKARKPSANGGLIERPHPIHSQQPSFTSTDFYPGAHSTSFPAKSGPTRQNGQASYNESTFSRPSARTSLERLDQRDSADRTTVDAHVPPTPNQRPAYSKEQEVTSSPTSTSYNDFVYLPLGNSPPIMSTGTFGGTTIVPSKSYLEPQLLSDGAVMSYPPLSPAHIAQSSEGHVPLLSIDTASVSTHSNYSSDSPTTRAPEEEWNPEPPGPIMSPISEASSQFMTPPSSPPPPPPRSHSRSPNPYNTGGVPSPVMVTASTSPALPALAPIPTRSPHRLPPIAAAHHAAQAHMPSFILMNPTSNGNGHTVGNGHGSGHGHHEANVKRITRDRLAMLSRASVTSQDSHLSTTSSRPPGVGSTRTRINLSMTRE